MEKYKLEGNDSAAIFELYSKVSAIKEKYILFNEHRYNLGVLVGEKKRLFKLGQKNRSLSSEIDAVQQTVLKLFEEYNYEVREWNSKIDIFIQMYNYLTLRQFLEKYPLTPNTSKPTLKFATTALFVAQAIEIPIIKVLLTTEPKFINSYPKEWLLKVYKELDSINELNFTIEFQKFMV